MAPRDVIAELLDRAVTMRREARDAVTEAQAQRARCELMRTKNDDLRARLRDRYPNRFSGAIRESL
jgi:hypothetical protein